MSLHYNTVWIVDEIIPPIILKLDPVDLNEEDANLPIPPESYQNVEIKAEPPESVGNDLDIQDPMIAIQDELSDQLEETGDPGQGPVYFFHQPR